MTNMPEHIKLNVRPINYSTMTEMVSAKFIQMISDGTLKPGDRLPPERELSIQFNVGRSTIREALKLLSLSGLLEAKRGCGTFVKYDYDSFITRELLFPVLLSSQNINDLMEVRFPLEIQAVCLASLRANVDETCSMRQTLIEMTSAKNDYGKIAECDIQFHESICRATHNQLLLQTMHSIQIVLKQYIEISAKLTEHYSTTCAEHEEVFLAIEAHDTNQAEYAMTKHLNCSIGLIVDAFNTVNFSEEEANLKHLRQPFGDEKN